MQGHFFGVRWTCTNPHCFPISSFLLFFPDTCNISSNTPPCGDGLICINGTCENGRSTSFVLLCVCRCACVYMCCVCVRACVCVKQFAYLSLSLSLCPLSLSSPDWESVAHSGLCASRSHRPDRLTPFPSLTPAVSQECTRAQNFLCCMKLDCRRCSNKHENWFLLLIVDV